jgi:D-glycero-D-manno-heptose 1,7-bisphosphate phosphatase
VSRAATFLDRDGVLNQAIVHADGRTHPPDSVEEMIILPGVPAALARLKAAGYALIVVTNQPDIARGRQTRAAVDAINDRLNAELPLDEIRVCPHDDKDHCLCRKPRAGLLTQPPAYDLGASIMVGDRARDIEAGRAAGVRAAILVDYQYTEPMTATPDARVPSLAEAADWILRLPPPSDGRR